MPVFEVTVSTAGANVETVTIQDERDLAKLSMALVDNGFVATEEVKVVWTGIEYQGHTDQYTAIEPVGQIALFSASVVLVRQLDLPAEQ